MSFINDNNFLRWTTPSTVLQNQEFTTNIDYWFNDLHPINGSGGQDFVWNSGNGGQARASGTPNYSSGLAQLVTITKGNTYSIEISIDESNDPSDKKLFFVDGSGNYQLIFDEVQDIDLVTYAFTVVADANYTKIVFTSDIIPSGLNTQTSVQYLRLTDITPSTCYYSLPICPGDEIKSIINYVFDEYVTPFGGTKLGLYNVTNQNIYLRDIATVQYLDLTGLEYQIYFEWTVPETLPKDDFRFVLYKDITGSDELLYLSNRLQFKNKTDYTVFLKYRNQVDALNYKYTSLSTFYNQIRVDAWTGRSEHVENMIGYQTYVNDTIRTRTSINKKIEFETRFLDEGAHEAFFAMLVQSEFYIDGIRYKKAEGDEYAVIWSEFDSEKIGNGSVKLMVFDYSEAINLC